MTRIGIAGDTHGNLPWMLYAADKFYREDIRIVLQLGDFGIWPGGNSRRDMEAFSDVLVRVDQTWWVTPGNHEDYTQINALEERTPEGALRFQPNIHILPRGHRWEWDGLSFVSLGGAPSVDRGYRRRNRWPWWSEEMITWEDVELVQQGGHADVMVCHDAPNGVKKIEREIAHNPHGFDYEDLVYAQSGRVRLTKAVEAVKPNVLLHGHYHFKVDEFVAYDEFTTRVMGFSRDDDNFSLGVLDTETRVFQFWDIAQDYQEYRWR